MRKIYILFLVVCVSLLLGSCGVLEPSNQTELEKFNSLPRPFKIVSKDKDSDSSYYQLLLSDPKGKLIKISDSSLHQLLEVDDVVTDKGIRRGKTFILNLKDIK